jgi:hypothetical protein
MIYRVALQRRLAQEAAIEVEAESRDEAESIAEERAESGMVNWFDVCEELGVEVVMQ